MGASLAVSYLVYWPSEVVWVLAEQPAGRARERQRLVPDQRAARERDVGRLRPVRSRRERRGRPPGPPELRARPVTFRRGAGTFTAPWRRPRRFELFSRSQQSYTLHRRLPVT